MSIEVRRPALPALRKYGYLAAMGDHTFTTKLGGEPIGPPWDATGWDGSNDWEFTSAASDTPGQLYALWDGAVRRSRARLAAALADGGPGQLVHASWPDGRQASLRRLLCDLIEEYGRHTGHADLLREAVDGLAGAAPATAGVAASHNMAAQHPASADLAGIFMVFPLRWAGFATRGWYSHSAARGDSRSG